MHILGPNDSAQVLSTPISSKEYFVPKCRLGLNVSSFFLSTEYFFAFPSHLSFYNIQRLYVNYDVVDISLKNISLVFMQCFKGVIELFKCFD